ncbi:MAG: Unknown protein [uncultured Sulfurovum sp.]|uniref:Calcineurin-like phosphoesterase domain-containing protein n=1 Tax=uncultured Sulfurovum sp. TaxID=269237 RepID=A0A6S6TI77_9BACT|nr:MAG: Unknown protein [uncultured Sulfurovum sp.]
MSLMLLPPENEYVIVGDVHGCIDELKMLLQQQGFTLNEHGLLQIDANNEHKSIVLLGDFIDKGSDEKLTETIEFIYKNYQHLNRQRKRFYLVEGNHENMVYRYITNDKTLIINEKTLRNKAKYYNTAALLEKNAHLKKLFLDLYAWSDACYQYKYDENFSVTLTHAPCEEKYLAQDNTEARKKMIKSISRSKNPKMSLDALMPYLSKEAKRHEHYHIFGHLSQANIRQYKNKICIDTSAIYGNELSCVIIKNNQLNFDAVAFQGKQEKGSQTYNKLFDF